MKTEFEAFNVQCTRMSQRLGSTSRGRLVQHKRMYIYI